MNKSSPVISDQSAWRFELKYRISVLEYHKMRIALRPYMQYDDYTAIAPPGGYLVRSLYFDTYDYRAYHEKMNGDHERIKFRIRTYSKELKEDTRIRAEMKVRKGNAMEKHGATVAPNEYLHFIKTRHWPENNNPILQEFERYVHLWALKPQLLVQYFREGYQDREKNGVRITFDQKVSGAHADTLFPAEHIFMRSLQPQVVILEIKCRHQQPLWLRDFVHNYGLRWVANSKFTQGIQASRQELYHPGGVVIIR